MVSDVVASRLASHAAASCSTRSPQSAGALLDGLAGCLCSVRCFAASTNYTKAPPGLPSCQAPLLSVHITLLHSLAQCPDACLGADAGKTEVRSEDQPGDTPEPEIPRVRAKRLRRIDKPNYFENEAFEKEV